MALQNKRSGFKICSYEYHYGNKRSLFIKILMITQIYFRGVFEALSSIYEEDVPGKIPEEF